MCDPQTHIVTLMSVYIVTHHWLQRDALLSHHRTHVLQQIFAKPKRRVLFG